MSPALWFIAWLTLPTRLYGLADVERGYGAAVWCTAGGLWGGLIIGFITEYYTSYDNAPV